MGMSYTVPKVSVMVGLGTYLLLLDAEASQEAILDGFGGTAKRHHGGGGSGERGERWWWWYVLDGAGDDFYKLLTIKLLWMLVLALGDKFERCRGRLKVGGYEPFIPTLCSTMTHLGGCDLPALKYER